MAPTPSPASPTAPQELPLEGDPELNQSSERFCGGRLEWFRRWTWGPHVQAQTLQKLPVRQNSTNKKQAFWQSTATLLSDNSSSSSNSNRGLRFGSSGSWSSNQNLIANSSSSSIAEPVRLRRSHQSPLTGCLQSCSSNANRSSSSIIKRASKEWPVVRPPRSATDSRAQPQQRQRTHREQLRLAQLQRRNKEQQCQEQQHQGNFLTFAAHPPQQCQEKEKDAAAAARAAAVAATAAECLSSSSGDLPSELRAAAAAAIRAAPAHVREVRARALERKKEGELLLQQKEHQRQHKKLTAVIHTPSFLHRPPTRSCRLDEGSYYTFKSAKLDGKTVELKNREEVAASIHRLHCEYGIPLCRQFGFRYSFLAEQHPLHRKAGSVIRKPLNASKDLLNELKSVDSRIRRSRSSISTEGAPNKSNSCSSSSNTSNGSGGSRWFYCIRIRMRQLQKPEELLKLPTQLGIFFHELAHLKFMNHGLGFARLLANIFRAATMMGLFDPGLETELPSPWLWERVVFSCGGFVSDELLQQLLLGDPKARAAAGAACDSARAAAPSDAVLPLNILPAAALQQDGLPSTEGSTSPTTTAASTPTQGCLAAAKDAASVAAKPRKSFLTTLMASAPMAGEGGSSRAKQSQQSQQQQQRRQQQQHQQRQQRLQPQKIIVAGVPRSLGSCPKSGAFARTAAPGNMLERKSGNNDCSSFIGGSKASISTCASSSTQARGASHIKLFTRPKPTALLNLQQQRPRTPRALKKKPAPRKMGSRRSSCSSFSSSGNSASTNRSGSSKPQQQHKRSGSVPGAQAGKRKSTPRKRGKSARRASAGAPAVPVKPVAGRATACVPPLVPVVAASG
ncbi:hypothetical protein Esti_005283 [Eimeria stiedai]